MIIREAKLTELDQAYMMGFETWGEGSTEEEYLNECRSSSKYEMGTWYVLEKEEALTSSLIVYENTFELPENCVGIGSVATPAEHREKGCASALIKEVISIYKKVGKEAIYLFSDIEPKFYEKLGFVPIIIEQPYKESCCMVNVLQINSRLSSYAPKYF